MENNSEYQQAFNKCLLETLEKMMSFLDKHNLKFWIAYGSAIGAVRHKGLIPWDDDIDVIMLRDDYNKLLLLKKEIKEIGLTFVSHEDEGYYFPFGKIYNNNTTLWEMKRFPFLVGVYIDIFPIDRTNLEKDDIFKVWNQFSRIQYDYFSSIQQYSFSDLVQILTQKGARAFLRAIKASIKSSRSKKLHKAYTEFEKTLNCDTGDKYVLYIDKVTDKYIYKSEWFENTIYTDYEYLKVPLPIGNHEILEACYGDYMTPPPISEQQLSHDFLRHYINLKESLTMREVKDRLQQGYKYEF